MDGANGSLNTRYATALVTGASEGLGRAFCQMLLAEGITVWGTSRHPEKLEQRPGLIPAVLDLDEPESIDTLWQRIESESGGVDLLINNAGYGIFDRFEHLPAEIWCRQISALLGGSLRLCGRAIPIMRNRGRGCIVNVSSLAAEFPIVFMSGYNVAKAGLSALSESLMIEDSSGPIKVIDFRPGDYRTGFNTSMNSQHISGGDNDRPLGRVWRQLEHNLAAAPPPAAAARDLRQVLITGKSGIVRSGSFFQSRLAPFLMRFASQSLRRRVLRFYFGNH